MLLSVWVVPALAAADAQSTKPAPSVLIAALPDEPGTCHLSGVILNVSGAPVNGAHVKLAGTDGVVLSENVTGNEGKYRWDNLRGGEYVLSVTAPGLLPATSSIRLPNEGGLAVLEVTLKIASVNDSVTVTASRQDIAEAEIQLQEEQRLVGVFPNFFVSYQWHAIPLTSKQKFRLSLKMRLTPATCCWWGRQPESSKLLTRFRGTGKAPRDMAVGSEQTSAISWPELSWGVR